jgi:hypothetical protein
LGMGGLDAVLPPFDCTFQMGKTQMPLREKSTAICPRLMAMRRSGMFW